ncbi:MAG: glycosyl hydrolase [Candidatus Acidiferrales bacterium]
MPDFTCSFEQPGKPFPHFWEHTVGSGHAPLALRADWQAQLRRCHDELGFRHVRFHALLSEEMETLICEENKLLYSFFNADQVMDFLLSIGMRPFVELSFMPTTLASGNTTVFRYEANVTPPKDYQAWATLIQKLSAHWVERYGASEVREWFFEVWNEPNLKAFWTGTQEDYFKLYRTTAEAIKSVDSLLKVGGPATADNAWIAEFRNFCEKNKVPMDFISTHHYPTDAFGKIGADTETQLQHAPPHVMREDARKVRQQAGDSPVYYTEWNISSNPRDSLHDESFTAACAAKIVMEATGLVQGYSYWTFSDIFAENYFPSVPFQGGFGLLNIHGIAKPVYRAFELLHRLGNELLAVEGEHATVDAWMVRDKKAATILLTNHAMPRHAIQTELVKVRILGAPRPRAAFLERIDGEHANPRKLWTAMGEPRYLSALEVEQLKEASCLMKQSQPWTYAQPNIDLAIDLPPHAVAAITLEFD